MHLFDLLPDADHLCALEANELGLIMLPVLVRFGSSGREKGTAIDLDGFLNATTGFGPSPQCKWGATRYNDIRWSVREAWAWLEGQALLISDPAFREPSTMRLLSSKALKLASSENPLRDFKSRRLEKDSLHKDLQDDVWSFYHRGKFDTAVFEATKAVEVAVRKRARLASSDLGRDLMRKAFHPDTGPLTDKDILQAERQALSDLFAGAIGYFKNPQSHRDVDLTDPAEVSEIITIASWLLRQVDACPATTELAF